MKKMYFSLPVICFMFEKYVYVLGHMVNDKGEVNTMGEVNAMGEVSAMVEVNAMGDQCMKRFYGKN